MTSNTGKALQNLGVATLVSVSMGVPASQAPAPMMVSARVAARTHVALHGPAVLNVTEADLARGMLQVPAPVLMELGSNAADGLEIDLHAATDLVAGVRLHGPGLDVELPAGGGTFAWRRSQAQAHAAIVAIPLKVDLRLQPGARTGPHAWPFAVHGRPLETLRHASLDDR